jgi:hypothetical protein
MLHKTLRMPPVRQGAVDLSGYVPSRDVYLAHFHNFRYAYAELRGVHIGGEAGVSVEQKKRDALAWVRDKGTHAFSLWATCLVLGFDYGRTRTRLLTLFDSTFHAYRPPASPDPDSLPQQPLTA